MSPDPDSAVETESAQKMSFPWSVRATFLASMCLFFLPFFKMRCEHEGETTITVTQSGLQMTRGVMTTHDHLTGKSVEESNRDSVVLPAMVIYGLLVVFGLLVTFCLSRTEATQWLVATAAAWSFTCLLSQFVISDKYRSALGRREWKSDITIHEYTIWLYLSFVATFVATAIAGILIARGRISGQESHTQSPQV